MRIPHVAYSTMAAVLCVAAMPFSAVSPSLRQAEAPNQASPSPFEPSEAIRARLQGIIKGIIAAWEGADVVCLGEDHGSRNDSDLRIALVENPDFARTVRVVIAECASVTRQDLLDRFILDGQKMSREELSPVWREANGAEVWESPIYEAFLRAVHRVNLSLPREGRIRVLGGDDPRERNRGKFIRDEVSRQILDKHLKALAIYGSGHCECRGGGFPGELADRYPGRIWAAFNFYDVEEGRKAFGLGNEPLLIPISGTAKARIPAGKIFYLGRPNDKATLGDITDAVVYYGDIKDSKVRPETARAK